MILLKSFQCKQILQISLIIKNFGNLKIGKCLPCITTSKNIIIINHNDAYICSRLRYFFLLRYYWLDNMTQSFCIFDKNQGRNLSYSRPTLVIPGKKWLSIVYVHNFLVLKKFCIVCQYQKTFCNLIQIFSKNWPNYICHSLIEFKSTTII